MTATVTEIQAQINEIEAKMESAKGAVKANYVKKLAKLRAELPAEPEVVEVPEVVEPEPVKAQRGRPRKYVDAYYAELERQSRTTRGRRSLTELLMDCERWNVEGVDLEGDYRAIELALLAAQAATLEALRIERPKVERSAPATTRTSRKGGKFDGRSRSARHSRATFAEVFAA